VLKSNHTQSINEASSFTQSQINEEDEESKHGSSSRRDFERQSKNS